MRVPPHAACAPSNGNGPYSCPRPSRAYWPDDLENRMPVVTVQGRTEAGPPPGHHRAVQLAFLGAGATRQQSHQDWLGNPAQRMGDNLMPHCMRVSRSGYFVSPPRPCRTFPGGLDRGSPDWWPGSRPPGDAAPGRCHSGPRDSRRYLRGPGRPPRRKAKQFACVDAFQHEGDISDHAVHGVGRLSGGIAMLVKGVPFQHEGIANARAEARGERTVNQGGQENRVPNQAPSVARSMLVAT